MCPAIVSSSPASTLPPPLKLPCQSLALSLLHKRPSQLHSLAAGLPLVAHSHASFASCTQHWDLKPLCRMGIMQRSGAWAMLAVFVTLALVPMLAVASDPDPLQDFCVAMLNSNVVVNGFPCKPAGQVVATDFMSAALVNPGNTNNANKAAVTPAFVGQFPGLNTQGLGAARIDFAVGGLNPPHTHPRASELLLVLKGELYVGFVSTNGATNTLFATTIKQGQLFVFPRGLVHFQLNVGNGPAIAFAALNSQNPNAQAVAPALFESVPPIEDQVLETAFGIDDATVQMIRKNLAA